MKKTLIGGILAGILSGIVLVCLLKKRSLAPESISTGILKTVNNEWRSSSGTIDLINIQGSGYVPMIWMALTGGSNQLDSILKVYVDGETNPSINADLGSLSSGHLYDGQFSSQRIGTMINGTSNMAFYFGFPIPYSKSIRITLTLAKSCIFWSQVYYNDGVMKGKLYSSCQPFLTAPEIQPNERQTLLNIKGRGKVVYIQQTLQPTTSNNSFMEGNHRFFVDGNIVMESSGTEDFYLSGFYFAKGTFIGPFVGCVSKMGGLSAFRDMYGSNTVPEFKNSILIDWQNGEIDHPTTYPTKTGYVVLYYLY